MDRWEMGGWMSRCMSGRMDGGWRCRWEDGQVNGFMDGWVGKRVSIKQDETSPVEAKSDPFRG